MSFFNNDNRWHSMARFENNPKNREEIERFKQNLVFLFPDIYKDKDWLLKKYRK